MRTFLCDGARFLQQQGWTHFPWSRSLFLIGIPFWAYFAGSFPYRSCSQVYPKRGKQVIHLFIQTWLSKNPCLAPSTYLMPSPYVPSTSGAFSLYAVGFKYTFSSTMPSFRVLSHTTVSHDEPTSNGPLPSVSLFFTNFVLINWIIECSPLPRLLHCNVQCYLRIGYLSPKKDILKRCLRNLRCQITSQQTSSQNV